MGGAINASRLPERWFTPTAKGKFGMFDYWLNSHQLMHILVTIAMLHLHLGATADYWYSVSPEFVCPSDSGMFVPSLIQ